MQWTFDAKNPVIQPGALHGKLDAVRASSASIVQLGEVYRLYYWGTGDDYKNRILMAESPVEKPNIWKPLGAALEHQEGNAYNCGGPSFPCVMPVDEKVWYLYCCGWGTPRADNTVSNTTLLAISEDGGLTWNYHGNEPVIPCDKSFDYNGTGSVCVLRESGKFRLYYTAIGDYFQKPEGVQTGHGDVIPHIGIAYAVSDDGIHWEKPYNQLLIKPREFDTEPYEYICSKPCIVKEDTIYRMWVNTFGTAYRVRSLVSHDGLTWTWNPCGEDGEMAIGEPGTFDDKQRCYAAVLPYGQTYRCWYTGNDFGITGIGFAAGEIQREIS